MKNTAKGFKLIPLSEINQEGSKPLDLAFGSLFRYRVDIVMEILEHIEKKHEVEEPTIKKLFDLLLSGSKDSRFTYDDCSFLPARDQIPARILVKSFGTERFGM
tara:strand:+ start:4232 stop:4543 length:312 start_codon:yes stop_codon:yes gene_type:complete